MFTVLTVSVHAAHQEKGAMYSFIYWKNYLKDHFGRILVYLDRAVYLLKCKMIVQIRLFGTPYKGVIGYN